MAFDRGAAATRAPVIIVSCYDPAFKAYARATVEAPDPPGDLVAQVVEADEAAVARVYFALGLRVSVRRTVDDLRAVLDHAPDEALVAALPDFGQAVAGMAAQAVEEGGAGSPIAEAARAFAAEQGYDADEFLAGVGRVLGMPASDRGAALADEIEAAAVAVLTRAYYADASAIEAEAVEGADLWSFTPWSFAERTAAERKAAKVQRAGGDEVEAWGRAVLASAKVHTADGQVMSPWAYLGAVAAGAASEADALAAGRVRREMEDRGLAVMIAPGGRGKS